MSGASWCCGDGDDGALELRVNGVFVMDDQETSSEELLASAALEAVRRPDRVLVGGLGLGYTVRALLADSRLGQVMVAEIEPDLVCLDARRPGPVDPRRSSGRLLWSATCGLSSRPPRRRRVDAILLDVDNGPDFLVYNENSAIYSSTS